MTWVDVLAINLAIAAILRTANTTALAKLAELQPLVDAAITYDHHRRHRWAGVLEAARDYAAIVRKRS